MYLHLENNILLPKKKIMGIFDLDNASWEKQTKDFLNLAQKEGRIFTIATDIPESFVAVCEDFGIVTLYLTGKSTQSLAKRMESKSYLEENY